MLDRGSRLCYAFAPVTQLLNQLLQQAPAASGPAAPAGAQGFLMQFGPLILIFGVFYFLLIRPQSKKAKLHQQMLSAIKAGDDVVTTGGILGKVTGVKDDKIILQVQEGVRLQVMRSHVQGFVGPKPVEATK